MPTIQGGRRTGRFANAEECVTNIRHKIASIRRTAMEPRGNNQKRSVTRRNFLKTSGVAAGAAGLAPAISAPFVSTALAQTKTLRILQWSHFVPQYDTWFD